MLNFILGLIVGAVVVKLLDSRPRLHEGRPSGNDRLFNRAQSERRQENLEKVMEIIREKGAIYRVK